MENSIDEIVAKYITRESHSGSVNRLRHLMAEELKTILAQEVSKARQQSFIGARVACSFDEDCKHCKANKLTLIHLERLG